MIKEILISFYLFIFKLLFNFFNRKELQEKTTFIISFRNNSESIIYNLNNLMDENHSIVILDTNNSFENSTSHQVINFNLCNPKDYIIAIYHIATSKYIFIDNYYAFLSVTNFKEGVLCIQLWHAVGALKLFGLKDVTNEHRSKKALQRFKNVYKKFDKLVVGSTKMETVFKESFGIKNQHKFLRTGIPRTDFFFNPLNIQKAKDRLKQDFPLTKDKKIILYAPTYREENLNQRITKLQLDLDKMYHKLKSKYVLLLRLHPAINYKLSNNYPDFLINVSDYKSLNTLIVGTDLLISDYSSIPFEFSLLNKPMIFYVYDLDDYKASRGLPNNFENIIPGPIAKSTDEILFYINENNFNLKKIESFSKEWNQFSKGRSTYNLLKEIYGIDEIAEKIQENI